MNQPEPQSPWRIGVDVGGTFTDMVLHDNAGDMWVFKAPSVPADPSRGVLSVLDMAAEELSLTLTTLLKNCVLLFHGSKTTPESQRAAAINLSCGRAVHGDRLHCPVGPA
mgnify:CR=1 FL=1